MLLLALTMKCFRNGSKDKLCVLSCTKMSDDVYLKIILFIFTGGSRLSIYMKTNNCMAGREGTGLIQFLWPSITFEEQA